MDFITSFPNTHQGHDSIWVIIDRLTKLAHFVLVRTDYHVRNMLSCMFTDCEVTWCTKNHNLRSRAIVHSSLLGIFI
jgi:hypothetical protein